MLNFKKKYPMNDLPQAQIFGQTMQIYAQAEKTLKLALELHDKVEKLYSEIVTILKDYQTDDDEEDEEDMPLKKPKKD